MELTEKFAKLPQPVAEEIDERSVARRTIFIPCGGSFEVYPEMFKNGLWLYPPELEKFLVDASIPFEPGFLNLTFSNSRVNWCVCGSDEGSEFSANFTFKDAEVSYSECRDIGEWRVRYVFAGNWPYGSSELVLNADPQELKENMNRFDIVLVFSNGGHRIQLSFHSVEVRSDVTTLSYGINVRQGRPSIILYDPAFQHKASAMDRKDAENLVKRSVFWQLS